MKLQQSPVHDIVSALVSSLREVGASVSHRQVEAWGFAIHAALSAAGREFHNHEHVIGLLAGSGPLEAIAALYHDAVYIQVDHGPPRSMADVLHPFFDIAAGTYGGWRIRPEAQSQAADVLTIFGHQPGDVLTPHTGLNELASAMVAWQHLHATLDRVAMLAIVAAIEQTIPFRVDPIGPLAARLQALQLDASAQATILRVAVRVGNLDVANFAADDPAEFLSNTWKLLPEINPALQLPLVYTVVDYRVALQRTESFMANLAPARVFHAWANEPSATELAELTARAARNLSIGVSYLRAKLYAVAFVEALADATGGNVPLDYFMGGTQSALGLHVQRFEQYLPPLPPRAAHTPLEALLRNGRGDASSFDIAPSPIASWLLAELGEAQIEAGFGQAQLYWDHTLTALEFLLTQPRMAATLASAASNLLITRRDELRTLAQRLTHP